MAATQASIDKERKRIDMASKLDEVRKSLLPFKDRVPANSDLNELMQFVMGANSILAPQADRPETREVQEIRPLRLDLSEPFYRGDL